MLPNANSILLSLFKKYYIFFGFYLRIERYKMVIKLSECYLWLVIIIIFILVKILKCCLNILKKRFCLKLFGFSKLYRFIRK